MEKVILYSEINWLFLRQRHHYIADYFASRGYQVYFVSRVVSRIPGFTEIIRRLFNRRKSYIANNYNQGGAKPIFIKSFFLPSTNIFFKIYNLILWIFFYSHLNKNSIVYVFVNNPQIIGCFNFNLRLNFLSKPSKIVFDLIHNWWDFPYNRAHHIENVKVLCSYSDTLITDSNKLFNLHCNEYNLNVILPGVDDAWFINKKKCKIDKLIKVIFFGNFRFNSDLDLIKKLIDTEGVVVDFYGNIDQSVYYFNLNYRGTFNLKEVANILPSYDFTVLPYARNKFSSTISPSKYFECLATGLPILSNSELDHLPGWRDFIIQVPDDHIYEYLKIKMNSHNHFDQIAFAKTQVWPKRYDELDILFAD